MLPIISKTTFQFTCKHSVCLAALVPIPSFPAWERAAERAYPFALAARWEEYLGLSLSGTGAQPNKIFLQFRS